MVPPKQPGSHSSEDIQFSYSTFTRKDGYRGTHVFYQGNLIGHFKGNATYKGKLPKKHRSYIAKKKIEIKQRKLKFRFPKHVPKKYQKKPELPNLNVTIKLHIDYASARGISHNMNVEITLSLIISKEEYDSQSIKRQAQRMIDAHMTEEMGYSRKGYSKWELLKNEMALNDLKRVLGLESVETDSKEEKMRIVDVDRR